MRLKEKCNTKSCGCAEDNALATVKMCVIFLLFNPSLSLAAPIEPRKRPYEVKKKNHTKHTHPA